MVTRAPLAWLADHPASYGTATTKVTGDALLYESWSDAVLVERRAPYSDVAIEYPPGSLPFIAAPGLWSEQGGSYRSGLIALLIVLDTLGLWALASLGRREGSGLGAWLWIVVVPALGPLVFLRLDLVPAVATIWAVVVSARRKWVAAGIALGFAAVAKLYALLLLPLASIVSRRRVQLWLGVALVVLLGLLPFLGSLPALWNSVVAYHSGRGVQVESSAGLALLIARRAGEHVNVTYDFGAFQAEGSSAHTVKAAALAISVAVLVASAWLTARFVRHDDVGELTTAMFATLALLLVTGTVLSPQFLLWLAALGAALCCFAAAPGRLAVLLVVPAAALSQAVYPFSYDALLAGEVRGLMLLTIRNLLLLIAGSAAWIALIRTGLRSSLLELPSSGPGL